MNAYDLEVTGGVGGLEVQVDDLALAAHVLADVAAELAAVSAGFGLGLADELTAASGLDPLGAARAAGAVADALLGPAGVVAAAAALQARSGQLLVAAAGYRAAEQLAEAATEGRRWLLGTGAVLALPMVAGTLVGWTAATLLTGGDPALEAERFLLDHPGVVDEVVGSAPAAVSGLTRALTGPLAEPADVLLRGLTGRTVLPGSLAESAALLAALYAPGRPRLEPRGTRPAEAPQDLGDVVAALVAVDRTAAGSREGLVVVTTLRTPLPGGGERVAHLVQLPGTKHWQPDPRSRAGLNDLASNLELMAGEPNARVESVRLALRAAGVRPDEPVLLSGHSQGGMVAVRAAEALTGEFAVTHVVTAGSPVGRMPVPDGVQVLSLENRQDPVPRLDAVENAPRAGHVTVQFDVDLPRLGDEHRLAAAYLPAAEALGASDDPSVRAWTQGAAAFLGARSASSTGFVVTNETGSAGPVSAAAATAPRR